MALAGYGISKLKKRLKPDTIYLSVLAFNSQDMHILMTTQGLLPTITVAPGETFLQTNGNGAAPNLGWPITPATAMNIKLTNASATVSAFGTLIIGGTST